MRPDQYSLPNLVISPFVSHEFLNDVLPFDEAIVEVMGIGDAPWEAMIHCWTQHPH